MKHKAGFVAIIGKPNVGKSTLLNALLGEQLSVVTPKAQTTRHRIKGILNGDEYQIVFSDTPGVLKPAYTLQERMMDAVDSSLEDSDAILLVVEIGEKKTAEEITERLSKTNIPLVLVINKIDLTNQEDLEVAVSFWEEKLHPLAIIPVSATEGFNTEKITEVLLRLMPENPPYFPKEDLSDRNVRFFVSEIIREQILKQYSKEIPYSCEVIIHEYKESPEIDRIRCEIFVDRESQKAIILGNKGSAIKQLGTYSRKKIEQFVGKHVFLELTVKVKTDWRNDPKTLDRLGYQ
ncbi:MAG: GTPase Era [Bacteroidota bacterium]|jgi:GTP-binding protein Era